MLCWVDNFFVISSDWLEIMHSVGFSDAAMARAKLDWGPTSLLLLANAPAREQIGLTLWRFVEFLAPLCRSLTASACSWTTTVPLSAVGCNTAVKLSDCGRPLASLLFGAGGCVPTAADLQRAERMENRWYHPMVQCIRSDDESLRRFLDLAHAHRAEAKRQPLPSAALAKHCLWLVHLARLAPCMSPAACVPRWRSHQWRRNLQGLMGNRPCEGRHPTNQRVQQLEDSVEQFFGAAWMAMTIRKEKPWASTLCNEFATD